MSTSTAGTSATPRAETTKQSETFSSRNIFILSAIGSAVGLGNIWRFPYVTYDNGGGAFMIPYLVALLTAGIPLLFFDYALGHRYRGSTPLTFRRIAKWLEGFGWWQVAVCFVIAAYYAVIIAWAVMYMFFSFNQAWGDDAKGFLYDSFLHLQADVTTGFTFVPEVLIPQLVVWAVTIGILAFGVSKGIARANLIFMPLLVVMFVILVVQSLFLPGALDGLNSLFTPNWEALADPGVWAAAYGQIFFSLSVGFGIMVTYSSYLERKTDLTGSGFVVAFANSSFELLAGIGVFAALGFMAHASGTSVDEVATGGIGLAFVAFPTLISQAPFGPLIGVLFFGSLVFAGLTSLISLVEVVIAAVRDKMSLSRLQATFAVGIPLAALSLLLFPTTTGLYLLDVVDEFVNKFGILAGALATLIAVVVIARKLPLLARHISRVSSISVGKFWMLLAGVISPLALTYILVTEIITKVTSVYGDGDYPVEFVNIYGWGMALALIVVGALISLIPWKQGVVTDVDEDTEDEHFTNAMTGEIPVEQADDEREEVRA